MIVIDGLRRIINSAKVQTTVATAFTAWVTYYFSDGTPAEKAPLKMAMVIAVGTCVGIVLIAWGIEDASKKGRTPETQVNVGGTVENTNVAAAPVAPAVDKPEPPKPPTVEELLAKQSAVINQLVGAVRVLQVKTQPPPAPIPTPPAAHGTSA